MDTQTTQTQTHHAFLVGEIYGLLLAQGPRVAYGRGVELEVNKEGDYTGRILITRPSGKWEITINPYYDELGLWDGDKERNR